MTFKYNFLRKNLNAILYKIVFLFSIVLKISYIYATKNDFLRNKEAITLPI